MFRRKRSYQIIHIPGAGFLVATGIWPFRKYLGLNEDRWNSPLYVFGPCHTAHSFLCQQSALDALKFTILEVGVMKAHIKRAPVIPIMEVPPWPARQ